jgi:hypothetical protein
LLRFPAFEETQSMADRRRATHEEVEDAVRAIREYHALGGDCQSELEARDNAPGAVDAEASRLGRNVT